MDNQNKEEINFMETQDANQDWFNKFKESEESKALNQNPVAYFCAEYALDSTQHSYAGGLGVLAGDYIRETGKQGFPLIAVGLHYKKAQSILNTINEEKVELKKALDKEGKEIIVSLPLEDRIVSAKAFIWEEGNAKVYLLDTDIEENAPEDRLITECLYDENRDTRLKQEILLGIAGFRLLAKLGHHASVYHLNEGHSAFLALELVRHEMEHQRASFEEACTYAKKHIVFTNHTLVAAGQEQFLGEKVGLFLGQYAEEMGLMGTDIAKLGSVESNNILLSMTTLSFNLSSKSNGVSKLHAEKAKLIWPEQDIDCVTNGIFIPRWDKIQHNSSLTLWEQRLENKKKLVNLVKEKTGQAWKETDLIFVWARRLVEYKQPMLFLDNIEQILEMSKQSPVPIRIIYSGPTGANESPFVSQLRQTLTEKLPGIAVFLPNYSTELAEVLTAGADIWLNTPIIGTEACGTSGMKAALNGALSLSTNDGWIYETKPAEVGFVVNQSQTGEEIRYIVKENIIPLYASHLENPQNSIWSARMEKARNLILQNFSATRMLREYIEKLYIPTLKQKHDHSRQQQRIVF